MNDKGLYWGMRIALGTMGILFLFKIVPYLTDLLNLLVELFKLTTTTTPEFKISLVCISLWITCSVINVVVNLIFKLHSLLENKLIIQKRGKKK